jgi:chemotaxis protein MotB
MANGWVTFIAIAAAGGLGYLAYHEHERHRGSELDAARLGGETKTCADADKQLADCTTARDADKAKREETEKLAQDTANNLSATKAELDELRQEHADKEKRLAVFKALGERLRKMIDAGKLEVTVRHGRMIVKLPAEVLFPSGSAQLSAEGQAPLREVAAALRQFGDRRFMVAGHTDNVPIGPSNYKSNWELSTARAVTVTEFMASVGMNPARLVAAGYSEYDPIRGNNTEPGRSENRRIEIVLLPNVEEISGLAKVAAAVNKNDAAKPNK